jgi:hypothetical protein
MTPTYEEWVLSLGRRVENLPKKYSSNKEEVKHKCRVYINIAVNKADLLDGVES